MAAAAAGTSPWGRTRSILQRISAVCFDLSGTLHIGDTAVGNAVAKLASLRRQLPEVPIVLLSNTSKVSKSRLAGQLRKLGVEDAIGEELEPMMLTSISACAERLDAATSHPLLITTDDAALEFASFAEKQLAAREGDACDASSCTDVVVALAPERLHYRAMDAAFRVLRRPGARLVAAHKGAYQRDSDGALHLGPGPFVAALEQAAGVSAEVVGKPSVSFLEEARRLLESRAGRALADDEIAMVGDDARDDAGGAAARGWTGVLVQTGKFTKGDAEIARAAAGGLGSLLTATDVAAFVDALVAAKAREEVESCGCSVIG